MTGNESLERLSQEAIKEIGENKVNLEAQLNSLKDTLEEHYPDLQLPPNFDDFLVRCLRVRKFEVKRAAKLVSHFFKFLDEAMDLRRNLKPSLYKDLYATFGTAVLKFRDSKGRIVVLTRQVLVPPDVYNFDQALAATVLVMDEALRSSVDTQRLGVVFVCDWEGFSFAHFRQYTPGRLRTSAKIFQDAFPARFKGFHFIRNPSLVSAFYAVVKPFLREKLKNRVHFHGHDYESLHKYIGPDILPQFLGGILPDDEYDDKDLTARLVGQDNYYKGILKHGYP